MTCEICTNPTCEESPTLCYIHYLPTRPQFIRAVDERGWSFEDTPTNKLKEKEAKD